MPFQHYVVTDTKSPYPVPSPSPCMASLSLANNTPNPNLPPHNHSKPQPSVKPTRTHFTNLQNHAKLDTYKLLYKSYFHSISSLCKESQVQKAVDLLTEMKHHNLHIGPEIYGEILQSCVCDRALFTGQQVHATIIKNGDFFARNEYIETKLIVFYAKCDVLDAADVLFGNARVKNVFSWAAIIGLYCRMGLYEDALMGYCEMQENGLVPDNFVVPNALKACGMLRWIEFGRGVHGFLEKMGFGGCVFVASGLIDMYGKCGELVGARSVFDGMDERNSVSWNSMIVSYVQNGMNEEAMDMFYDMRVEGLEVTRVTLSSFLSAAANVGGVKEGRQGHAISVLGGLELDNILGTSVINFYTKVNLIEDAEMVFKRMIEKDVVTWNLFISGYVQCGQIEKALNMCRKMRLEGLRFDSVTLASVLSASANANDVNLGKEAHCYCIRNNLESDMVVANTIVHMYADCGRIDLARYVFDTTTQKDLIMWNTLIAAYAEMGMSGEALKLFYQMQLEGVPPNVISLNSVILGFLRNGQVSEAKDIFLQMKFHGVEPNLLTWTTLISGLAQDGLDHDALQTFVEMQEVGVRPNIVSINCALAACTKTASLSLGRAIHCYVMRHKLLSSIQIATSLLDMYAKCGNAEKALMLFRNLEVKELATYNVMISCHALHGQAGEALAIYKELQEKGIEPDSITFTNILSACSHVGLVDEAIEVFNDILFKYKLDPSMEHYGCVVSLLCRCGNLEDALRFVMTMPYEPDAHILGSLLAACREHGEIEHAEYIYKHLQEVEPDNSGNYVAISNAFAAAGMWDEVYRVREKMKEEGMRKDPGCSWVQVGEVVHVFTAGDRSHSLINDIYAVLALLDAEMHSVASVPSFCEYEILTY